MAGSAAEATPDDRGAAGRIRAVSGGVADVDVLAGVTGRAVKQVIGRASMPLVGFPMSMVLRAGDRVGISKTTPGFAAAAMPLCHWVIGIPRAVGDGSFVIAGERALGGPGLAAAAEAGSSIKARLLDTDLDVAQVLAVRSVSEAELS